MTDKTTDPPADHYDPTYLTAPTVAVSFDLASSTSDQAVLPSLPRCSRVLYRVAQVAKYRQDGFLVVRGLLDEAQVRTQLP